MDIDPSLLLLTMLIDKISAYEDLSPEFSGFNEWVANRSAGVAVIRVLMDQHSLPQSDFENRAGDRSQVSPVHPSDLHL